MDFDTIETGGERITRRLGVLLDDLRDFCGLKRLRRDASGESIVRKRHGIGA
jgi:hypothetical protein